MELSAGVNEIYLSLHSTYCAEDDGTILQAVAKYKPFMDWLTRYQPSADYSLSRVTVRNIQWIAKRIAVLSVDVELTHAAERGHKLLQSATFTDEPQASILPILSLNGHKYGVLIRQPRVALGGGLSDEALMGSVTKEGFVGLGSTELTKAGFKLGASDLVALRSTPLFFGDGLIPQTLYKTSHSMTLEEASGLLNGIHINDINANGAILIAAPLAQIIANVPDLRAVTAASLALQK